MANNMEAKLNVVPLVDMAKFNQQIAPMIARVKKLRSEVGDATGGRVVRELRRAERPLTKALDPVRAATRSKYGRDDPRAAPELRTFGASIKQMEDQIKKEADLHKKAIVDRANRTTKEFQDMKKARTRQGKLILDATKTKDNQLKKQAANTSKAIKNSFSAAFSLHIISQFVSPFISRVNNLLKSTITVFAEFDKLYADYIAKSEDFGRALSRQEMFQIAAGQTFSLNAVAEAGERFAASGIDVVKNQKAITDILKVATIANVDYKLAANSVIKTVEAFQLTVHDSTMIVDSMTAAANASTAELKDMVAWFEFTAGAAYTAGLEVNDLSEYLGILSSSGLKNVGTSFRQFLVQFQKVDIREKFAAKFGFAIEDFRDMNKVIDTMRGYVQNSGDATAAAEELTQMLGGKVNAMQALNRLMLAQPELWGRLTDAVGQSGVTSDLYTKATDNAGHSIERIQNSIALLQAQIGDGLAPILKQVANLFAFVTEKLTSMPKPMRAVLGVLLLVTGAVAALGMALITLVSFVAVLQGATALFMSEQNLLNLSTEGLKKVFLEFGLVMTGHANTLRVVQGETNNLTAAQLRSKVAMQEQGFAAKVLTRSTAVMSKGMGLAAIGLVGFAAQGALVEKQLFGIAHGVNVLTGALIALQTRGLLLAAGLAGPLGWALGIAAGIGTIGLGATQISGAQTQYAQEQRRAISSRTGTLATSGTAAAGGPVNININGFEITGMTTDTKMGEFIEYFEGDLA